MGSASFKFEIASKYNDNRTIRSTLYLGTSVYEQPTNIVIAYAGLYLSKGFDLFSKLLNHHGDKVQFNRLQKFRLFMIQFFQFAYIIFVRFILHY